MFNTTQEDLDLFIDEVYQKLDVPEDTISAADKEYKVLSDWMRKDCAEKYKSDSALYPQGSALFGTSVRPVKDEDDFDYDLVYLRMIQKESITKENLKKEVGEQLERFVAYLKAKQHHIIPTLKPGKRCWTLKYGSKFHMDILPALPDTDHQKYLVNKTDGIILTDKTLHEWCFSNPKGYNTWFKTQMKEELNERKLAKAKASVLKVEEIPDNDVKTILQRAIQILKRHRDVTYMGDKEDKPISIIITTLATKSYKKTGSLSKALKDIVTNMASYIETKDGQAWIASPINPGENFADKWKDSPKKKESFYTWLKAAQAEFSSLESKGSVVQLSESLKKSLGENVVNAAYNSYQIKSSKRNALRAAVSAVKTPTAPHAK